ncbi:MAG: autotransporter assembly complex family protein [Hyphomicrobiales bacterium]
MLTPSPAQAFDLFGFHLWGEKEDPLKDVIVDPVTYEPVMALTVDDPKMLRSLESASLLISRKAVPPSGTVGLLQRAKDDQANLIGKLYEDGRFGGIVKIRIDGRPIEEISVIETFARPGGTVPVSISIDPGPPFRFGRITVAGADRQVGAEGVAKEKLVSGGPASSTAVRAGAEALVLAWQREGHPFAKIDRQEVVADHATDTVDVTFSVAPGPVATIGEVTVTGAETLEPDFILQQADVPVGARFSPDILERTRRNLARIEALGSAIVSTGDHVDAQGRVPILIEVSERKLRSIGVGGYYSSTDGPGGQFFWLHRNLFGRGETLRLEADAGREFTSGGYNNFDTYNWRAGFDFTKPGIYGPRVDWTVDGEVLQEDTDPYFRRGGTINTGLSWRYSDQLTLTGGIFYDYAHIEDAYGDGDFSTLGLSGTATYDTRNSVIDPTSGLYAWLLAEPQYSIDTSSPFFTGDAELRLYHALDADARYVLAARGRVGSILAADLEDIPAHRRFYAGGGGSVRGYDYLGIGPRLAGYGPTGGLSRAEGSLEARVKITDTIGIVPFVDAGYVAETTLFHGNEEFRWAAGLGLRYYTAVGPIRLDVAVPINPGAGDPNFALYFGIGQSF